jgi:hypothetical protein
MALKKLEKKYILDTIENEGFDYAFEHYTDFAEVEDVEFHTLRESYLEAMQALKAYVGIEE